MIHLEKENFDEEIKHGVCLVDFYANWCGPCKMLAPVLEQLDDKIKIIKVNIDEYSDLANKYKIMSIPTLLFIKDGEVVNEKIGFCTKEEIENIIEKI